MKRRKPPKKRNPHAQALEDPLFRQRRVGSDKVYDRNKAKKELRDELTHSDD